MSGAGAISPPKTVGEETESFNNRARSTHPLQYYMVPGSFSNIRKKSTHRIPPPTGVPGPNQSRKHRECQGREGSISQSLRGEAAASQGPPAGNPALYPCLISLDCKIYAVLLCNLRAFEKERKGVGEEPAIGENTFIFIVTISEKSAGDEREGLA